MNDTDEVIDVDGVEEETQNLPAVREGQAIMARAELSVEEIVGQKDKIKQIMDAVMVVGIHYGLIPGVSKPSLFKPGAEAINVALRLAPYYDSEKIWHEDGHLTVVAKCTLKHVTTDLTLAQGEGLCTTREERYAFRQSKRVCPNCQAEAIIKGRAEYGGGWVCWRKEGGCGTTFQDGSPEIENQTEGKVPNPNIADLYNTVLKMADKRALIAAVLNGTAASDVFTQDVEDQSGNPGPPSERRVEGPAPLPPPKSWAQITEYISAYDEATYTLFNKFADAARRRLYPESESTKDLTKDERAALFQTTGRAALRLRENVEASAFPPPTLEDIRQAWASVMDGEELAIPDEPEE